MEKRFLDGRVLVKIGDITEEDTDAIVNAANSRLLGGSGVDGAIHRRGGDRILEECKKIRRDLYPEGLPAGEAVMTTAGLLPASFVIHTVGPIFGRNNGRDAELLAACYENSLHLAARNELKSVAFPSISTGVYGYPKIDAARVSSQAIADFVKTDERMTEVRLVFFSPEDAETFLQHHGF